MALLEQRLRATEAAAMAALQGLPADRITRRNVGYLPPDSDRVEIDVMALPDSASGQLVANAEVEARLILRVLGRNQDGTLAMDVVRWLCDVVIERLFASADLAALLAQATDVSWNHEFEIANGAPVVTATTELRTKLRHGLAGGPAAGIAARVAGSAAHLRSVHVQDAPVIYPGGLQITLIAPAVVAALFASVQPGDAVALRLLDGQLVESFAIAGAIGRHDFTGIPAGQYRLHIVRAGESLAQTDVIDVQEIPS
jgi:hypothetical protein